MRAGWEDVGRERMSLDGRARGGLRGNQVWANLYRHYGDYTDESPGAEVAVE